MKKSIFVILVLVLVVFGLFTACEDLNKSNSIPEQTKVINDISGLDAYLFSQSGGTSPDNPINLAIGIDLAPMTASNSGWRNLLTAIQGAGKYVRLDLSACTIGTAFTPEFNPDYSITTGKDRIVSLVLPNVAASIPGSSSYSYGTFRYFTNLRTVSGAKNSAFSIGAYAFRNCTALVSADFPRVTSIGEGVFFGCTSLTSVGSVGFPLVTSIGKSAFSGCTSLTSAGFPKVTSVGQLAFSGCTSLTSVNFPLVTSIDINTFNNCTSLTSLTSVNFPLVSSINRYAFRNCTSLTSVSFPATTNITGESFTGCILLTSITLTGSGSLSVIEGGKVLVRNNTLVAYPSASGSIIFNTITSIGEGALSGCTGLTSVSFPLVSSIDRFAFSQTGPASLIIELGPIAPLLSADIFGFDFSSIDGISKTVTVKVPAGATGYIPSGETLPKTYSGPADVRCWGDAFRGNHTWDGTIPSDWSWSDPNYITLHIVEK